MYDYKVTVNKVIDGKVTLVNEMTFCTDSERDPLYKPYIITGLDREKYTSQNMEIPAMVLGKVILTENGDFYEFTMGNGYFLKKMEKSVACFDLYFRRVPDQGGFAIAAGLESVINFLDNLSFSDEDIEYLRGKGLFSEEYLEYLRNFKS